MGVKKRSERATRSDDSERKGPDSSDRLEALYCK